MVLCLGIRVLLQAVGIVSLWRLNGHVSAADWLGLWVRWDAPHFMRLAEVGYVPTGEDALFRVFLPAYPAAVRVVSLLVGSRVFAGLVVSLVASVAAGWFLYRLVRIDRDHREAWRGVVLFLSFPAAYFMAAPYTEAMFLAALLAAMYAARRDQWPASGVWAAIATATRIPALAALPALAVEALHRPLGLRSAARRAAWLSVGTVGFLVYLWINWAVYGDPLSFLEAQRSNWHHGVASPSTAITDGLRGLLEPDLDTDKALIFGGRLLGAALAVVLLLVGVARLRLADQVYGWAGLVIALANDWLISLPRYLLGLYPLFIVGAHFTRRRPAYWTVVALGVAAQMWLFARYARGWWTF